MPPTLIVDEVMGLLLDVRDFDDPPREKELHNLLYFIKHRLQEKGIEADIQCEIQSPEVYWSL